MNKTGENKVSQTYRLTSQLMLWFGDFALLFLATRFKSWEMQLDQANGLGLQIQM